jgi:hypothetical protein
MTNYIKYEVTVYANGDKLWRLNGEFHREDGPALEYSNGGKHWLLNGKYHREDGPAIDFINGDKCWYLNGKLHREDGPAIDFINGDKCWYLNDESLTEEEHKEAMNPTVEMTMAQINEALGKNVKVVK